MGSACSPWVTLADPGGGGWDGSCWHLAPCMSASPLGAFPRSAPDLALGVPPPLVPSFSPSLLRPVPRGGARLSLPDRELSVFGWGLRQARDDSPAPRLHGRQSRCVDKTRQGTRPGVWGVDTLLHRSLYPCFLQGPTASTLHSTVPALTASLAGGPFASAGPSELGPYPSNGSLCCVLAGTPQFFVGLTSLQPESWEAPALATPHFPTGSTTRGFRWKRGCCGLSVYPQNPQAEARRPMGLYLGVVLKEEVKLSEVSGWARSNVTGVPMRGDQDSHTRRADVRTQGEDAVWTPGTEALGGPSPVTPGSHTLGDNKLPLLKPPACGALSWPP